MFLLYLAAKKIEPLISHCVTASPHWEAQGNDSLLMVLLTKTAISGPPVAIKNYYALPSGRVRKAGVRSVFTISSRKKIGPLIRQCVPASPHWEAQEENVKAIYTGKIGKIRMRS